MNNQVDNFLLKVISKLKNKDCNFILLTKEYKIIRDKFLKYIGDNFEIKQEFNTINSGCYHIGNYIVKFSGIHIPEKMEQITQLVKIYCRENYRIEFNKSIIYLGFEIQDFICEDESCDFSDLYNTYKSLRDIGYIWVDASYSNVKKKNNKVYIIDSDYIYKEDEVDYFNESRLSKELREKFEKEKHDAIF